MPSYDTHLPDLVPVLSRGKHRSPRKGACFMEMASYLAGERWSDHPSCTHPLLAAAARLVNDHTSDAARQRLAPLIPAVIGLTSDDLRVDARLALCSARMALPIARAERQRVLAVSVLTCERVLADLDGRPPGTLEPESRAVLEQVPHAAKWAANFAREIPTSHKAFRRHGAPSTVRYAVDGIAQACVADPDRHLYDLLVALIGEAKARIPAETVAQPQPPATSGAAVEPRRRLDLRARP